MKSDLDVCDLPSTMSDGRPAVRLRIGSHRAHERVAARIGGASEMEEFFNFRSEPVILIPADAWPAIAGVKAVTRISQPSQRTGWHRCWNWSTP